MVHRRDQGAGEVSSTALVSAAEFDKLDPRERAAVDAFLAEHPVGEGAPLAVVIPAFNEEPTVADVIREIPAEAAGLATETIVVVDGARDATAREAISAGALVCDVPVNRGQGAALKLGYWLARARGARVIVTIDADGQYAAEEIGRVLTVGVDPRRSGRLRLRLTALGQRADDRFHPPRRRDRVRSADLAARPPPRHRPGVRPAGDGRPGDCRRRPRTASVSSLGAADLRGSARLPPRRGADHDA
jgi:hypothetical protein